jgi:hypothetical protein
VKRQTPMELPALALAFAEQKRAVIDIWRLAGRLLGDQVTSPPEFRVRLKSIPESFLTFERNIFSTLFIAVLDLLDISASRRRLYARLNQLFRVWVTSADNLLDDEDKEVLCLEMPGKSRVMRQVVAVMLADRILAAVLAEGVRDDVINHAQAEALSQETLRILLPSAAEEGLEEGGYEGSTDPEFILHHLHRLKTGILFHLPFAAPELVEEQINHRKLGALKDSLMKFGTACQVLDDIRDVETDYNNGAANYVTALAGRQFGTEKVIEMLCAARSATAQPLFAQQIFPEIVQAAATHAVTRLKEALGGMEAGGMTGMQDVAPALLVMLLRQLGLESLAGSLIPDADRDALTAGNGTVSVSNQ